MKTIDLRSDTVTRPDDEMRKVLASAPVGDDVYGEDPSINQIEQLAAQKTGKEAALFVPSGTMANQIAVMVHTRPGDEIIVEATSHIFLYEAGGLARLGGVQTNILIGDRGLFSIEDLQNAIRAENIHFPKTTMVAFENTHNRAGGRVLALQEYSPHLKVCSELGIATHLDGARLFNAAVALGVTPDVLVSGFDSVSFCLSKGLGAPVGSLLCGRHDFIKEARRVRKILGGGMRQGGILAAAGIYALEIGVESLVEDHQKARLLAQEIEKTDIFSLKYPVESNILIAIYKGDKEIKKVVEELKESGVLVNMYDKESIRLVTHKDVGREEIMGAAKIIAAVE